MNQFQKKINSIPWEKDWVDVPILSRIYAWSIIFEPLMFFILFQRSLFGIPGSVARILQMIVLICVGLKIANTIVKINFSEIRIINLSMPIYQAWVFHFLLLIIAGFVGWFSGNYELPAQYQQGEDLSAFSRILNSASIRPLFEYLIAIYYAIYFVIFPLYILQSKRCIEYFFHFFKITFYFSLIIGFIDIILIYNGIEFIPRHIADGIHVGSRFHGLAGEPRQAFPFLFLGLALIHLYSVFSGQKFNKVWIPIVAFAACLTQSLSGFLGIFAFIGLYIIFGWVGSKKIVNTLVPAMFTLIFVFLCLQFIDRVSLYIDSASNLWNILEAKAELPYYMFIQRGSIYPLYDLTVKIRNLDLLPVLIGSGLGSASAINNLYDGIVYGTNNPNSQFVRTLYEAGILGMFLYIIAFVQPVSILTKHLSTMSRNYFVIFILLLVGVCFGVRSTAAHIYLGIFIATFSVMDTMSDHKQNHKSVKFNKGD